MLFRYTVGVESSRLLPTKFGLTGRTDELFDIIVDYPESLAALEDLKVSSTYAAFELDFGLTQGLPGQS